MAAKQTTERGVSKASNKTLRSASTAKKPVSKPTSKPAKTVKTLKTTNSSPKQAPLAQPSGGQTGPARILDKIFAQVAAQVSPPPSEAEAEKKFALGVIEKLEKALYGEGVKVFFVGSAARDTGLKGDNDIDLFVSFPTSQTREQIVEKTIRATKTSVPGSWEMHYAEHPYLQAKLGEFKVEVIPCFKIDPHGDLKSAVDRSPLHMDYLQKRLSFKQKRDVRVLKQLLKRAGIYGAEARIGGFSGLVCEYLILNYRSLSGLLESACSWKPPVAIDLEGARAGEDLAAVFNSPLVIVDAIDKKRNAGAAVSLQNLVAFISLSQALLQKPSMEFFLPQKIAAKSPEKIALLCKARGTFLCLVEFPAPKVVEDILFPQVRKTLHSIAAHLEKEKFALLDSCDFEAGGKLYFIFEFSSKNRPGVRVFQGPPGWNFEQVKKFADSHPKRLRGPYLRGEKTFIEERQNVTDSGEFLSALVREGEATISIGSKLEAALRRAKIIHGKEIGLLPANALLELQKYLEKKEFWL